MARSRIFNKIKYSIKTFFKDLIFGVQSIIYVLMLKDPCETCIVKACCRERCELKSDVINSHYPYETLHGAQIFCMLVLTVLIIAGIVLLFCIYKGVVS